MAMLRTVSGSPSRAVSMMTSVASRGSFSGLTGQTPKPTMGRSRSSSWPPTTRAAISTILRTSQAETASEPTHLLVLLSAASVLCRHCVSGGTSAAPTADS